MARQSYDKAPTVTVYGVKYPLLCDPKSKVWRIRKRTKDADVYHNLKVVDLAIAKTKAREWLEHRDVKARHLSSGRVNLATIAKIYEKMPRRCSDDVAKANVQRLAVIVKVAWGKTLEEVSAAKLSEGRLWEDYATARHDGKLDLSTRRRANMGINSAIRMAVSVFHEGLHEDYRRAGIALDFPAIQRVRWLPVPRSKVPALAPESIDEMMTALVALKDADPLLWRAIMLARFAGLRCKEIRNSRRDWLTQDDSGLWQILIYDREEIEFQHKTGADYAAPILSKALEDDLLALPEGPLVPIPKGKSETYFYRQKCSAWLRQHIPPPNKTMHRLRSLYTDHLRSARALQIRADQEGIEAAKEGAGHTTSKTTKRHYLSGPEIRTK